MGNSYSSTSNKSAQEEFKNFYDVIDYIATYYILTMDFKSLSKLSEKAYCDKLVVLTSDIIKRYFNEVQITYLAQRIKNGVEVNDLKDEKVIFINKDNLESLDVANDTQKSIRKKRVCIGIAKFYIKIAHIFAAIVMTINPVYTYKGPNGETVKTSLMEKDSIPKNVSRKLYKLNICDNRIRALKKGEEIDEATGNVTLQPKICDMNLDKNGTTLSLEKEPGIPELLKLYLDDEYDYSNGTFTGMSESTQQQFFKDLNLFYTAFTGNEKMPPEITKFSDIKLRDYRNKKGCQSDSAVLKTKYTLNKNNKLFIQYAENTKNMIQNAADNQSKLLSVINELFTYVVDPYTNKKVIRVNPKLTEELLQKAVEKARRLIVNLYVKCENDYTNGIKLYEAIVESKILETTKKQIENLEKQAKKQIDETKKIVSPIPVSKTIASKNIPAVVINEPSETIIDTATTSTLPSAITSTLPSATTSSNTSVTDITSSVTPSTTTSVTDTTSSVTPSTTSSNTSVTDTTSSVTPSTTTSVTDITSSVTPSTTTSVTDTTSSTSSTDGNKNIPGLTESSYNSLPTSDVSVPPAPTSSTSTNTTLI